ncbi:MAG: GGDEF domain-containing protein, partial [Pseudomonadota bacterium]
ELFPQAQGALYIYSNSRDVLDLAVHWGGGDPVAYLEPDECWALRRGRSYFYGANAIEFPCAHTKNEDTPNFCLPIVAHGDTIGLMNFAFADHSRGAQSPEALEQILQPAWELGLICAEQISLAIANVRLRMELQDQSVRDQLTGLWNRRWFVDMLAKEIARSASRSLPLSLISIDVDHFKRFNDHHGHDAGDAVLRHVGEVLASQAQDGLAACRVGGEEFAMICPGFDQDRARALGDDLRDRVSEIVVRHGGQQLPRITMSAGVASLSEALRDPSALIKGADQALYAAKAAGRDQVKRFTDLDQSPDLAASA